MNDPTRPLFVVALLFASGCGLSNDSDDFFGSTGGSTSSGGEDAGSHSTGGSVASSSGGNGGASLGGGTRNGSGGSAGSRSGGAPGASGSGGVSGGGGASSGGASGSAGAGGDAKSGAGGSAGAGGSGALSGSSGASGGGGASSGGASGSAGASGSDTAGASSCSKSADNIFCEDFEDYASGPAMKANGWTPVTNNGSLTVDGTHARGKNALHVHTQGNGKAFIQVSPFAPPQNSFFGRMRVWVTAFPTAPDYAHFTLVEAAGAQPGFIRPVGGQYIPGKGDLWGTGSDGGPTGDWTNWKESAKTAAGTWLCVEWQMAAADNRIQVWIDGEAKPDLTVSTKNHGGTAVDFVFPTFNSIWFGWWLYQNGTTPPEFDLWLDDIALGVQRLGC